MEIKTLNEQIERLRELIRKCYATVAGKNGTVPEVGERNMENLPAAIASTHDTLEELTITANGEYTPQDGVDGFSKVTAEFDTSSLPKVKVSTFKVTDACINEDGIWEGDSLIDTSECTSFVDLLRGNRAIKKIDVSTWDTSKVTSFSRAFDSTRLTSVLDVSNWDVSNGIDFSGMFSYMGDTCPRVIGYEHWNMINAKNINGFLSFSEGSQIPVNIFDFRNWYIPNVTTASNIILYRTINDRYSLVGGISIDEVIANNVCTLRGLKVSTSFDYAYVNKPEPYGLDRASLRALINGLADLTGQTAQTLTLGATLSAKLTEEDIAIAVNKNWNLA